MLSHPASSPAAPCNWASATPRHPLGWHHRQRLGHAVGVVRGPV